MGGEYGKLLKFLAVGCVLVFLLDQLLGETLRYLERNMRGGERARTYNAVHRANADVFVFGSSRALYHYSPAVMRDELDMEVYNAGRSAQTVLYHLPLLKMILKRHIPKLVILDINEDEFVADQQKYDIVNFLLPYYNEDPSVRSIIDEVRPHYKYFSWSKALPYNSSAISMLWRTIHPLEKGSEDGYSPVFGRRTRIDSITQNCGQRYYFDSRIEHAFDEFVGTCQVNRIPLLVIVSPRTMKFACEREDFARVKAAAIRTHVPFLDLSSSEKYRDHPEWMHDSAHLNNVGSSEFSKEIASYLSSRFINGRFEF